MISWEQINTLVQKIAVSYQPEKILLFGSYAQGNAQEDSDLDILVIKETTQQPQERILEVKKQIRDKNRDFPLDLLIYTPQEITERQHVNYSFIKEALSNSIILYEKS